MRDRGLACGGGAGGQKAGGATPVRKVSRHALRFAASSGRVPTGPKKRKEKRNGPPPIAALRVGQSRN